MEAGFTYSILFQFDWLWVCPMPAEAYNCWFRFREVGHDRDVARLCCIADQYACEKWTKLMCNKSKSICYLPVHWNLTRVSPVWCRPSKGNSGPSSSAELWRPDGEQDPLSQVLLHHQHKYIHSYTPHTHEKRRDMTPWKIKKNSAHKLFISKFLKYSIKKDSFLQAIHASM